MKNSKYISAIFTMLVTASLFLTTVPVSGYSYSAAGTRRAFSDDAAERIGKIESKVEARRKELGIPGMSLAIVKDGRVVYAKGLGFKDFENKVPATADTQFAIGSATKAFTALSVLMLQDENRLSLDDNPGKHLPYFKINNPDTNARIQVRDLLAHSSGLNRTDLAMVTGKLNREELIKVAGVAVPQAGLREQFFYQNIMFAAAGEIVARVYGRPWEEFVPEKIFAPLGMTNSTMRISQMKKAEDYSFGYDYNFDTKQTRRLPSRDIDVVAPAGSINSSAADMAKWLRFILDGGKFDGRQLVSKESFDEWIKPQTKITPDGKVSYGLGWFIQEWNGKKVVQHGGNIDGFNSMVAMVPEENLGFVMLTNVTASSLGNELMQIVFSGMLDDPADETLLASDEAKKEVGVYKFPAAGFDINIAIEEGKLVMKVPGQPTYVLQNVEGRKYKLSNAPDGFFITFKDNEAFLEQPQGSFTLPKAGSEDEGVSKADQNAKELIGKYESKDQKGNFIEIRDVEGKPSLVVPNQPTYPLVSREGENEFGYESLPAEYGLKADKDEAGKVKGITLLQPNGNFKFELVKAGSGDESAAVIDADELYQKMLSAMGGEKMREITSRVSEFETNFVHQGVTGKGKTYARAPDSFASDMDIYALGKKIGWLRDYFDGTAGGEYTSFTPANEFTGQRLKDIKYGADFYAYLDPDKKVEKAEVTGVDKVNGEDVYRLRIEPIGATALTLYVSTKTFLPMRRTTLVVSSTSSQRIPIVETYEDYREVDGVMLPFKVTSTTPTMGDVVTTITKISQNKKISDKVFKKK